MRGTRKRKKRLTCVMGDSMVKQIKSWEVNKNLDKDFIVVRSFPGAKSTCMEHYSVPTLGQNPDNVIIHVGTNDLKSTDTASKIASRITNLAVSCANSSKVLYQVLSREGII